MKKVLLMVLLLVAVFMITLGIIKAVHDKKVQELGVADNVYSTVGGEVFVINKGDKKLLFALK